MPICRSTFRPFMAYCCHVWNGAPDCFFDMLDELGKRVTAAYSGVLTIFAKHSILGVWQDFLNALMDKKDYWSYSRCFSRTLSLSSKCSQCVSVFCRCYFGRSSSELTQLHLIPHSCGGSTSYYNRSSRLHDFSVMEIKWK